MGNEIEQKPEVENPSHNFPGSAEEEQQNAGGALGTLADNPALDEVIPLIGTVTGLARAGFTEWDASTYRGIAENERKEGFDPKQTKADEDHASHLDEEAIGHVINAIPLVGFARGLM